MPTYPNNFEKDDKDDRDDKDEKDEKDEKRRGETRKDWIITCISSSLRWIWSVETMAEVGDDLRDQGNETHQDEAAGELIRSKKRPCELIRSCSRLHRGVSRAASVARACRRAARVEQSRHTQRQSNATTKTGQTKRKTKPKT